MNSSINLISDKARKEYLYDASVGIPLYSLYIYINSSFVYRLIKSSKQTQTDRQTVVINDLLFCFYSSDVTEVVIILIKTKALKGHSVTKMII